MVQAVFELSGDWGGGFSGSNMNSCEKLFATSLKVSATI
jgi:hypothetical protein